MRESLTSSPRLKRALKRSKANPNPQTPKRMKSRMKERYLTFEDYLTMGGALAASEFDELETIAEAHVDRYTFNRLRGEPSEKRPESLKLCVKMLIGLLERAAEKEADGLISSVSNDGVSVSYSASSPEQTETLLQNKIKSTVYLHLAAERAGDGTPLIFGGVINAL